MKRNLGNIDISVRFVLALTLYFLAVSKVFPSTLAILEMSLAAYFLITSFINICPLYQMFHIDTFHHKDKNSRKEHKHHSHA